MNPLRILITNNTLADRAGTEMYVYDLSVALIARGHQPIAYSNRLGEVARELREVGVPVIDRLESLGFAPDIIHGHHHLEAMTALLHFPNTPAIYFCHSWKYWEELPVRFPRIRRYLAMNQATYNRLTCEHGIPESQVKWMPNFVDLNRFKPRVPLPSRPQRALMFSNHANEQNCLPMIRSACERAGLALDVIGLGVNNLCARPWEVLGNYDLIFATGRSALEAMAVGAAVIVCNHYGLGPMVSTSNFDQLRRTNFGFMATLHLPFTAEETFNQIAAYKAEDAAEVSRLIRASAGIEATVDQLLEIYRAVITEQQQSALSVVSLTEEMTAAGAYLRQISDYIKGANDLYLQLNQLQSARHWLTVENEGLKEADRVNQSRLSATQQEMEVHHNQLQAAQQQLAEQHAKLERSQKELTDLGAEAEWMRRSLTWRMRQFLIRAPGLSGGYQAARRFFKG